MPIFFFLSCNLFFSSMNRAFNFPYFFLFSCLLTLFLTVLPHPQLGFWTRTIVFSTLFPLRHQISVSLFRKLPDQTYRTSVRRTTCQNFSNAKKVTPSIQHFFTLFLQTYYQTQVPNLLNNENSVKSFSDKKKVQQLCQNETRHVQRYPKTSDTKEVCRCDSVINVAAILVTDVEFCGFFFSAKKKSFKKFRIPQKLQLFV